MKELITFIHNYFYLGFLALTLVGASLLGYVLGALPGTLRECAEVLKEYNEAKKKSSRGYR